ncbi:MAG: tetratricopeptide (TPR) repeat protein [Bacteroidia bacterium]
MDFSKQLKKADESMRRRNFDFAVDLYRSLLDINPDLGEARAGLRQAVRKRAERKKRGLFSKAGGAIPLGRAKAMAKVKKFDGAVKALEDYLSGNPTDEAGNLMLGQMLEAAGHNKSAFAVYAFLAEIAPKNVQGLKQAGFLAQRVGEPMRAIEYFEAALAADPRDQEAIKARKNLSAEAALQQTGLDNVAHSRDALKDKDDTKRLEQRQRRHRTPEELREEVTGLEATLAETPSDPELLLRIGGLYKDLRDWPAALEFHERALEYRRDDYDLECTVADLGVRALKKQIAAAGKAGDEAKADRLEKKLAEHEVQDFQRRVVRRPGDMSLRLGLGKRLMRGGELNLALGEFQKAHGDSRVGGEALFLMARCFHEKGVLDIARKEYERALEGCRGVDDRAKEILYNLGLISEAEGDPESARGAFIRIYEVDISYRDVAEKMEAL